MMDSYANRPLQELQLLTKHIQVEVTAPNGESIVVDEALTRLLVQLWERGYETLFSCQGGATEINAASAEAHNRFNGYIYFTNEKMAQSFYDIVSSRFPVTAYPFYEMRAYDKDTIFFHYDAISLFERSFS